MRVRHAEYARLTSVRTWNTRRVVWTSECIHIARKNDEIVIDSIPLAEALSIVVSDEGSSDNESFLRTQTWTNNAGGLSSKRGSSKRSLSVHPEDEPTANGGLGSSSFSNGLKRMKSLGRSLSFAAKDAQASKTSEAVIQIATMPNGFNSGPLHVHTK